MKNWRSLPTWFRYAGALLLVAAASLLCETVRLRLAPTNMVMVYLLAVVLAATQLGFRPALLTAALSVVAFDVLFVPPRFSLRVSDTEYLVTFFALFVVGAVISTLVARIQEQVEQLKSQEARTGSLFYLTRDLSGAVDIPAIVAALGRAVARNFASRLLVVVHGDGKCEAVGCDNSLPQTAEMDDILAWVMNSGRPAGAGTATFADSPYFYCPIRSRTLIDGVMVLESAAVAAANDRQLIEAFAGQAAMAIERVQLARQAEEARILRNKGELEQALLNSISHDLRTPLVTISGVLDSMTNAAEAYAPHQQQAMLLAAAAETARLNRFVGSLLDMTRLDAGALAPRFEPCEVEELVGCAVAAIKPRLESKSLLIDVAPDLPPIPADLALLTQALVNLLDNARKFSPATGTIGFSAHRHAAQVVLTVTDEGPGVPVGEEERIFEKFYRVKVPEISGGTGLGLSIAKGIIEAHHGTVSAANRPQGGLEVAVVLPTDARTT